MNQIRLSFVSKINMFIFSMTNVFVAILATVVSFKTIATSASHVTMLQRKICCAGYREDVAIYNFNRPVRRRTGRSLTYQEDSQLCVEFPHTCPIIAIQCSNDIAPHKVEVVHGQLRNTMKSH